MCPDDGLSKNYAPAFVGASDRLIISTPTPITRGHDLFWGSVVRNWGSVVRNWGPVPFAVTNLISDNYQGPLGQNIVESPGAKPKNKPYYGQFNPNAWGSKRKKGKK